MRRYKIEITGGNLGQGFTFESQKNGQDDPGALDVEWDIQLADMSALTQAASLAIWGIPLPTVSQQTDLTGATVTISGGFSKGLPLEQQSQYGVLAKGQVFQAFGNWIGTEMTLEVIFYSATEATQSQPANVSFKWLKGTQLSDNVKSTLATAFPKYTVKVDIGANLSEPEDLGHTCGTLTEFGSWLNQHSKSLNTDPSYNGVLISVNSDTISVFDAAPPGKGQAVDIKFYELIGQPVWIGPAEIQFACPMRSDINIFTKVTLPTTQVTQSAAQQTLQARDSSAFKGSFLVTLVQHKAKFRDANGMSWATIINAVTAGDDPATQPDETGGESSGS